MSANEDSDNTKFLFTFTKNILNSDRSIRWIGITDQNGTIQFLNYDKVRIQAPNKFNKVVNFRKMGFENQKNKKPNTQWELFYNLSRYRGDLSWTIATYRKKVDSHPLSTPKIRKQIQRLSNSLREYFNINDAPFYDYIKLGAYKTKFSLLPDPLNAKILP